MANSRILAAIETTKVVVPGYFESTCAQRAELDEKAAGSIIEGVSANQLEEILKDADWVEYTHEALQSGTVAYKAMIPGLYGIVELTALEPSVVVTLDDRKNTGKVSATVKGVRGEKVNYTIIILGEHQGSEVVFTFHPGDPVVSSTVEASEGLHGKEITVAEAVDLGLHTAKVV